LTGGLAPGGLHDGRPVTIGSELGRHLRYRVQTYPGQPGWQQTPDLGSFDFDDRGEMLIPMLTGEELATLPPTLARGSADRIDAAPGGADHRTKTALAVGPTREDVRAGRDAAASARQTSRLQRWMLATGAAIAAVTAVVALILRDVADGGSRTPQPL